MNLFGAEAFSPTAIMNAASIINGDSPDPRKKQQQGQFAGLIHSLFHHPQQPLGQGLQDVYGPTLMGYFGGA